MIVFFIYMWMYSIEYWTALYVLISNHPRQVAIFYAHTVIIVQKIDITVSYDKLMLAQNTWWKWNDMYRCKLYSDTCIDIFVYFLTLCFFFSLFLKKNYNNNTCILKRGAQTQRTGVKYVVVDMMYDTVFTTTTTTSTTVYDNIIPIKKIKNLLFGSEKLTLQNNLLLFDKIHSYIKTTHRFK